MILIICFLLAGTSSFLGYRAWVTTSRLSVVRQKLALTHDGLATANKILIAQANEILELHSELAKAQSKKTTTAPIINEYCQN